MDTTYLKKLLQDSIHHKFLEKYIKQPNIDEEKLIILSSLISNNTGLTIIEKEHYIITTMMVQIALDTHETVPVETSEIEHQAVITNQLKVLAGDYYSGLYYLLLSEIEDFDLIHCLAAAIKEINEYKMKLYYREFNTFDEYLFLTEKIDSLLILSVANYVNEHSLDNVSREWLLMNKLMQERESRLNGIIAPIYEQMADLDRSTFLTRIDTMIENKKRTIENLLVNLPEEHTAFKLHVHSKLSEVMYNNISIAEEG
ncbi:heptaprenyl diphosphate synthase [Oceanobacillus chungangensis]|uniref:Heptaprenyl diphosphate synthase n=2 Tax=Oceanobacillus chungangensis TaxID=1229152 RepID=A0A3D8Q1X3_9BACI|nr:heptaprenyl diphosphate synthase [Oceanobacillus chungangensis]